MNRDFSILENREFDLVVVGGGIFGSGVAWDAALRGLSVLLLERDDWGGNTSSGCFKIVHGGLRYIQDLSLSKLRESACEQEFLLRAAPHLVSPLAFVIPSYAGSVSRNLKLLSGVLGVYEFLSGGVGRSLFRHSLLSTEEVLSVAPGLVPDGLLGGVRYFDAQMNNCERLSFSVARSAYDAGAVLLNRAEVEGIEFIESGNGVQCVSRVIVRDLETLDVKRVKTRFLVNACGPWIGEFERKVGLRREPRRSFFSKGVQLILPKLSEEAICLESKHSLPNVSFSGGGRSYFIVPWRGRSLVGTYDVLHRAKASEYRIEESEIRDFLLELSVLYKNPLLKYEHVLSSFGGLRPMDEGQSAPSSVMRQQKIISYDASSSALSRRVDNVLSVIGVKYTTFRSLSQEVVDRVVSRGGFSVSSCRTANSLLYGGWERGFDLNEFRREVFSSSGGFLTEAQVSHLISEFGLQAKDVASLCLENVELAQEVVSGLGTLACELVYVARHEQVLHLSDVLFRRTALGTIGPLKEESLARVEEILRKI